MVLVDIFVPSVNQSYDFQLNETIPVGTVIEEIAEMVGQKEHCEIVGNVGELVLCDMSTSAVLNNDRSLQDEGVFTGKRLILV
ncbi:MAG: glutamyl-tRNA amidotransferase [Lachnospiraceae bacterium]|nr:glutamyl-tRNA amidotransferase [Lachnospiraceae bacterium]